MPANVSDLLVHDERDGEAFNGIATKRKRRLIGDALLTRANALAV